MSHTQLMNHNNTLKSGASVFSVKLFRLFRLGFPLQLERWEKKKGRASDGSVFSSIFNFAKVAVFFFV